MLRFITLFSLFVLMSACSSDGEERRANYLKADYLQRLELPPDLIFEDSKKQLVIPKPTERAMKEYQDGLAEKDKTK